MDSDTLANAARADERPCAAPRCALLTPPGRGAIATIGVRGPGAISAVGRCFRPVSGQPLESIAPGRVVFGCIQAEELVVGVISPEEIDVHCHGGLAAAEAILTALVSAGCRVESWRERIAAHQRDPIAAAALVALADARTERTATILLEQYDGALCRELHQICELIRIDPPQARERLRSLLARGELGRRLTRPWRVVLTGAPNVGKSSLINALLGYSRAIVFDQPGTTRDVLTATTAMDGWPVELADTAGLRAGGDAIEAEGVARALAQVAAADLVVEVLDATARGRGSGVGGRESEVGSAEYSVRSTQYSLSGNDSTPRPLPHLVVHNKCDLARRPADGRRDALDVSAKTGAGIDNLIQAIARQLVPDPPQRGRGVPFTELQISALAAAQEHQDRGDAVAALSQIELLVVPPLTPDS